jgi:hypothetical protein
VTCSKAEATARVNAGERSDDFPRHQFIPRRARGVSGRPFDYQERVCQSKLRKLAGTVWTMIRLVRCLPVGWRREERFEMR